MKINSIDIKGFGKLKNFHLDLDDRFTVFYGENETGKSTIMAFIRMMFYGNQGRASDIEKNPRKKYRPFNGDIMAGSITFTQGGRNYRLEREFKASNSADKITLIDLDTGVAKTLSGSEEVGAGFFNLSDGAFERSVFLGEAGQPSKNDAADGEINSRLSNIASSGDEDISLEKVSGRILKAKESLFSKSKKVGKYDKAVAELENLERELLASLKAEQDADALKKELKEKETQAENCSAESGRLFNLLKSADKIKKRIFVERYITAQKELLEAERNITDKKGNKIDRDFIKQGFDLINKVRLADDRYNQAENELSLAKATFNTAQKELEVLKAEANHNTESSAEQKLNTVSQRILENDNNISEITDAINSAVPEKKLSPIPFIIGGLIAILGVILTVLTTYFVLGLACIGCGVVSAVLGLIFKKTTLPDNSSLKSKLADLSDKKAELLSQKELLLEQITLAEGLNSQKRLAVATQEALLQNRGEAIKELEQQLIQAEVNRADGAKSLENHIKLIIEADNLDLIEEMLKGKEEALHTCENLAQRISVLADNANCTSLEDAKARLEGYDAEGIIWDISEAEIDQVKERFKEQSDYMLKLRADINGVKNNIKSITESARPVALITREIEELKIKIEGYKQFAQTADTALECLDQAFRELRKNFSGPLESKTARIFNHLTCGKYDSVNISKNFELGFNSPDAFGLKSSAHLSNGTTDQLYLALRLAVTELISDQNEPLPLFMDDPFEAYDETRSKMAIDFLKDYSNSRQTVLFTCHRWVVNQAKEQNITTVNL